MSPLHLAAACGSAEAASALLQAGANVNAIDEDGDTPLAAVCAIYSGDDRAKKREDSRLEAMLRAAGGKSSREKRK